MSYLIFFLQNWRWQSLDPELPPYVYRSTSSSTRSLVVAFVVGYSIPTQIDLVLPVPTLIHDNHCIADCHSALTMKVLSLKVAVWYSVHFLGKDLFEITERMDIKTTMYVSWLFSGHCQENCCSFMVEAGYLLSVVCIYGITFNTGS